MKNILKRFGRGGIAIILLAAALRFFMLSIKPPHFDEGVNGWLVDQMTHNGFFAYDPTNYHGPLHFYILFLAQTLFGRSILSLRIPVVLFSIACVVLVLLYQRFFNRRACRFAALAMAVSPAAVFYGRYAIHESELVFFMLLACYGALGLWRFGKRSDLWALAIGLTGMWLTKETWIIHLVCFALAFGCVWIWGKMIPSAEESRAPGMAFANREIALAIGVCAASLIFFYSGNFLDWESLKGIYLTYGAWFRTGEFGDAHQKAWWYWLQLIALYEWPALLGIAGTTWILLSKKSTSAMRWLCIYGLGALAAYSIVRYKTPWCIISLLWPFFFAFGFCVDRLLRNKSRALALAVSGFVALVLLESFAYTCWLNFYNYTPDALGNREYLAVSDSAQPENFSQKIYDGFFHYTHDDQQYIYVQTLNEIHKLIDPLNALVAENPANRQLSIYIMIESYHPLPWLLGDFTNVQYYGLDLDPTSYGKTYDADVLVVEDSRLDEVEAALNDRYFTEPFQLRDGSPRATLFFRASKFHQFFANRQPDFIPQ